MSVRSTPSSLCVGASSRGGWSLYDPVLLPTLRPSWSWELNARIFLELLRPVAAVERAVLDGVEMCVVLMDSAPSKSAIVRDTFKMRSWARALSPRRFMAVSSSRSHSAGDVTVLVNLTGAHLGNAEDLLTLIAA